MKTKTQDLVDAALDWAVASIEKLPADLLIWSDGQPVIKRTVLGCTDLLRCEFSTNWAQGGPIIEREKITITGEGFPWWECQKGWYAHIGDLYTWGDTPLEAAMRCYVASKLGREVDVPEELT